MKWDILFSIKFTISGNNWKQNTWKLINYLTFWMKKYKENQIVKKCPRWLNLQVVSRGKCNNDIKSKSSTGSLSIMSVE